MFKAEPVSSYGVLALLIGAILSVATTCGPPDPVERDDTGWWFPDTGGGGYTYDYGHTVDTDVDVRLDGVGDSVTHSVRVYLTENCLAEEEGTTWGSPTGWTVIGTVLQAARADSDTDTGVPVDTAPPDTGPSDTATDTGSDTASPPDTGAADTGTDDTASSSADARFHVLVVRNDGETVLDDEFSLYEDLETRVRADDWTPFVPCEPNASCEVDWTVTLTLTEGEAAEGDINVHSRIEMCSSRPGYFSDIAAAIE